MPVSKKILKIILLAACIFSSTLWGKTVQAAPEITLSRGQTIYVPVYSHIYGGNKERPFLLAVTLSIRNTDPAHSITITAADYYDTDGNLLVNYVKSPVTLKKFSSTRYVVKESDKAGGSGANFVVKWESDSSVTAPVIESVMIGTQAQQGISFTSRGVAIK